MSYIGGLFKIDSTEWTFKMPSEELILVHTGVNTDIALSCADELLTKVSN